MKHLILALCILSAGLLHAQVTTTAAVIDTKRSDGTFAAAEVSVLNSSVWGWSSTGTLTRFPLGTGLSINESGQLVATGGSAATWGSITGTLSAQVDLQSALDAKLSTSTAASTYVALAGSYADPAWITALAWSKISGTPTTLAGYGISDGLTSATAASTYVALAGSYADPAWITSLAWSKISGAPSLVTTFLGLTDTPSSYTGQAGKVVAVKGDASGLEFIAAGGTGTVTSVDLAGGTTGLTASGGPITTTGTITLGGTLALGHGGTGATTASGARTALELGDSATRNVGTTAGTVAAGDDARFHAAVTLAGSLDYLTLAGQVITLGAIDLATDTTGSLAWASVSKTGSSLADLATRSAGDLTSGTLDAARLPAPTTTALGGVKRNAGTSGQFVNGIASDGSLTYDTPAGGGGAGAKYVPLEADVAVTDNATLQDITGLAFSVEANKAYSFRAEIILVTSATATGSHFGWTFPASPTLSVAHARIYNTPTGSSVGLTQTTGEIASNSSGAAAERTVEIWGTFINGANAGTVQFTTKVETSITGTVTVKAGSVLKFQEITTP